MALHHPSTPEKPNYRPTVSPEEDEQEKKPRRISKGQKLLMGAVATGAAAAVTITALVGGGDKSEAKPEKRPAASAPEAPASGEPTPRATSTAEFGTEEARRDALEGLAPNPDTFPNPEWDKFPFTVGGETYANRKEFIDAMSISVEDYPNADDAVKQMFDVGLNNYIKSGADLEQYQKFTGYEKEQGSVYHTILNTNYYDPAFEVALGPGIEGFTQMHGDYVGRVLQTVDDPVKYEGGYKFVDLRMNAEKGGKPGDNKNYGYSAWLTYKFEDNGDETSVGTKTERYEARLVNLDIVKRDDRLYWNLHSIHSSPYLPRDEQGNDILPDNSLEDTGY